MKPTPRASPLLLGFGVFTYCSWFWRINPNINDNQKRNNILNEKSSLAMNLYVGWRRWNKNWRVLINSSLHSYHTEVRGHKCWDLSSDISKTNDPSPPTPNKVEFWTPWVEMSAFLATKLLGQWGGGRDEPKVDQKIVIKNSVLKMQQLLGRVFSHSLKFFILFPIVITVLWFSKHTRINFLLPASGIVDDVLHNGDTLKFSIRTCWPRVQSDPF